MELFIFIVSVLLLVNLGPIILATVGYTKVYPSDTRWKMFGLGHLWQIGVLVFAVFIFFLLVVIDMSATAVFL